MTVPGIERWERWWFPSDTGRTLAVCRILIAGSQLFVFLPFFSPSLEEHVALVARPEGFEDPQWLIRLVAAVLPPASGLWPTLLTIVYGTTLVAGFLTMVGFRTRIAAAAYALTTWFLVSHEGSYGEVHHTEIIVGLFLLFLALSPSGRRFSLDARRRGDDPASKTDMAIWPLRLTQILLAWSYFSNAVAKFAYGGVRWMNGYTLQHELLKAGLQWNRPLGIWLAQRHALCVGLSVATIVLELAFPLALVSRRARPWLLVSGVGFHLVTWWAMDVAFLQHIVLYAVFLDLDRREGRG